MNYISPLRYPGGKGKLYNTFSAFIIDNNYTDYKYVEPYAGGAGLALSLLINGKISSIHLNDVDRSIYAFWHSVLNETEQLIKLIEDVHITIDCWHEMKEIQSNKDVADLLELGFSTFFLNRTNRSGILKGGVLGGKNQTGDYPIDCRFNKTNLIERIILISNYRDRINISNLSAEELIINYLSDYTVLDKILVNFDPPYYKKGAALYTNFYSHEDHVQLEHLITQYVKTPWIMTYDNCDEICKIYNGYRIKEFTLNHSAGTNKTGKEVAIFSGNVELLPEF